MVDAADIDERRSPREHHGVSFEQWAFVHAGLGDGLALEELLAHLGLDEARWEPASEAFQEEVLDDVEAGGTLSEEFDEAMRAARRSWTRAIPPLDVELRAWLDFYRAWASAESPLDMLEAHGLRAPDIHRLQDLWQGRLAEDAKLRDEAIAILQAPPGPLPAPRPERPRLVTAATERTRGPEDTAVAAARATAAPLPFAEGEAAPAHPRLSVPLPLSAKVGKRLGVEETRVARAEATELVLPFLAPVPEHVEAAPSPPAVEPPQQDGEGVALSIERYAALCVDLIEAPDAHEAVLRRYGVGAADKLALDVFWTQKMAEDTTVWLVWDRACTLHRAGLRGEGTDSG